jgi:hypothetical protein
MSKDDKRPPTEAEARAAAKLIRDYFREPDPSREMEQAAQRAKATMLAFVRAREREVAQMRDELRKTKRALARGRKPKSGAK